MFFVQLRIASRQKEVEAFNTSFIEASIKENDFAAAIFWLNQFTAEKVDIVKLFESLVNIHSRIKFR
jgi:hypothetical protein